MVRLHLGCGKQRLPEHLNCDLYPTPATDLVFDLMRPWPLEDSCARDIYCAHVLEHLPDARAFFSEAHRVLMPNGALNLKLPYGNHKSAWWDIEHLRPWFAESFCFLQPGYGEAVHNPQHDAMTYPFGIHMIIVRLGHRIVPLIKHRKTRKLMAPLSEFLVNLGEELIVEMYALKTAEAVTEYRRFHQPNTVPAVYGIYRHEWEQRLPHADEAGEILVLGDDFAAGVEVLCRKF